LSEEKPFFQTTGTILNAETVGFYKIKGVAAKSGKCRHVSCGATSATRCMYIEYKNEYNNMIATGKYYGQAATATNIANQKSWVDNMKAGHTQCTNDWCVKSYGARPSNLGEQIKCTRLHLESYTEQELANPKVRPESVAINMRIALNKSYAQVEYGIALYDLIDDKWFNDSWWTHTGYQSTKLMPHKHADWPAPKTLALVDQMINALKASI
jgi:hypothetical protein